MGFSHVLRVCLQGGGVRIDGGTVTFSSCTITGNTAYYVRAHAQKFPSPQWESCSRACLDSCLHNCGRRSGQLQYVRATETLKTSHRPDGKTADALAPTHACTTANASVNYRMYVLQRPCKVPIAPMGFSHILRVRLQGGGVYVDRGSVTFSSCTITDNSAQSVRAQLKTSHRPDGKMPYPDGIFTCLVLCAFRVAVSMSLEAR